VRFLPHLGRRNLAALFYRQARRKSKPSLRVPVTPSPSPHSSLILAFTNSANRTVINSVIASTSQLSGGQLLLGRSSGTTLPLPAGASAPFPLMRSPRRFPPPRYARLADIRFISADKHVAQDYICLPHDVAAGNNDLFACEIYITPRNPAPSDLCASASFHYHNLALKIFLKYAPPRRFPPPWSVEESCFVVKDSAGQKLAYVYFEDEPGRRCQMHGARGGAPEGKRSGNYKHGARTKEIAELRKFIKSLR
jgi:hypothetical protein